MMKWTIPGRLTDGDDGGGDHDGDGGDGDDGGGGDGGDGVDDGDADDIARSARTFNKPNQSSPNREQMQFAM